MNGELLYILDLDLDLDSQDLEIYFGFWSKATFSRFKQWIINVIYLARSMNVLFIDLM